MFKKYSILIFLVSAVISFANAQELKYGNEWIKPSQKYYKISTAEDGIYRISYDELVNVGFPISAVDPRNIQIYHRGKEHAILIEGQGDGSFDDGDYIEFYGKRNEGTLDGELYITPEAHKRKYHNFYSDTTAYFLTWSLFETGKRMQAFKENNIIPLTPESYHINEIVDLQTSNYSIGLRYPIGIASAESYLSAFDYGEGWTGSSFRQGQFGDIQFTDLNSIVTSGPKPILEILLTGGNNLSHSASLSVGPDQGNLRSLLDVNFNHYYDTLMTDTLEWSDISNGNLMCRVSIPDNGMADRISISHARLKIAEAWDQNSEEQRIYIVNSTTSNRSYIEIQNVPTGAKLYDITDEENIIDIGFNTNPTGIDAIIQNDDNGRKLLLTAKVDNQVPKIEIASMRNIDPSNADFLIITHQSLRIATSNYSDVPKAYASYRASAVGGGYDTLVVNIDQLYNIFSFGEYTSLAIYRYCQFMAENGNPKYLFIMGKGLSGNYLKEFRNGSTNINHKDFIPTAGFPGNDVLFTAGLKGASYEAGFPVGRVSAKTPNELEAYFDKVKEMEGTPHDALWRKDLVHLSGGSDSFQQSLFRSYIDGFKSIAEGEMLGGSVVTFSKRTSEPEEFINISEEVNKGKMLVTFFGHSGAGGADMDIGYVSNESYNYNNKGKYPMLIVNGCLAGDMYNTGYGFGEDWIVTADKGAVGFIAHTNAGLTTRLKRYTDILYEVAFTDSLYLNKGIGDIQKEGGKRYLERYANSEIDISQVQQMALQGDPSISLFGVTLPDYEINADNVFIKPIDEEPINAFTEVFYLGLIIQNFGTTDRDSLKVTVNRRLSNGQEIKLDTLIAKPVYYKDTLYFPIKGVGIDGFGINQFTISLDPLNEIEELSETNNQVTIEEYIQIGGTDNIYPLNYSIVNKKEIKLIAQSFDLLVGDRSYKFELDTTKLFNSPFRQQTSIQETTIAKWSVNLFDNLPEQDTVVFYWRTIFEDDTTGIWKTTSFTYVKDGVSGWAMNHFQQFDGTEKTNVLMNQANQRWEFEQFETSISVSTYGYGGVDTVYTNENVTLSINGSQYIFPTRLCTNNSMNLVAFNKANTVPYLVLGKTYALDRTNCGKVPSVVNNMLNNEIENDLKIEEYIEKMGDGDFVVLFSIGNVTFQNWPVSTHTKLGEIGINSADITSLQDGEPIIILGKKGTNPGTAIISKADYSSPTPATEQEIFFENIIHGQPISGVIRSPKIGPASNWASFSHKTLLSEVPATDEYLFNIYGVNSSNEETLIHENITTNEVDLQNINNAAFPYLRLDMKLADESNLTPPQLKNWFVIYDGVPEGILSFKEGQNIEGNSAKEGEVYPTTFIFENVSDLDFADSIAVTYSLFNQTQRNDTLMIKPLASEEAIDFTLDLNTLGKVGKNDLKVFANPYIQLEQSYNNNFINMDDYLTVEGDNINPIMEVTVDGEFIMDGDIVSPSPMIMLRLKDENSVLLKEDTLGVNLYLNEKDQGTPTRISFSSPNVVWTPATEENSFMVEYQPQTLADGIYTLKAEAADASGNPSGTEPYLVSFEIINESQITNFFPYPNPFSTRTQFVFTLTGSDIPDEIIIQIMTVNGTVVREITQDEIGPIKIGNNKTEYAWDGRDEYGDQLANGVYLYKVKLYNNGEEMKHRSTSADKAFKHGIGKIYLLK